jgi:hypothetical protein
VIVHRIGVGHAGNGREAARHGGGCAGRHRFFVFLSGLAQVHVDVDQPGRHDPPGFQIQHLRAVRRQIPSDPRDPAILDAHVESTVASTDGIYHSSTLEQHRHDHSPVAQGFRACAEPR